MPFVDDMLARDRPASLRDLTLPRRAPFRVTGQGSVPYYPSPVDWCSEVLYFLLPDRFCDGVARPGSDRTQPPHLSRPVWFRWEAWARSGGERWQGGTLKGIQSRLDYLTDLGITAVWIGPLFKQRRHGDEYHGYAIQDFLEVDPHFGTRGDLVELVQAAHACGIRVILDAVFNHSGHNWDYAGGIVDPPYRPWPAYYEKGPWLDGQGRPSQGPVEERETGVWPRELQQDRCYTRAGKGSLSGEDIDDAHAEMRRTDFDGSFRDFNLDDPPTLSDLAECYKYWIALTDIDGLRLDTLKHVPKEAGRSFCGTLKEFACGLGKRNFFLVGEVGGPDRNAGRYLDALELNLSATLDIGESRLALTSVAKGLARASVYFGLVGQWTPVLGSHRDSAHRHVKVVDDHDHVCGPKARFSRGASNDHQVTAAAAILLFSLGIPCIYYGTEQAFGGPEEGESRWVPGIADSSTDRYLRETMFGAEHPRRSGEAGLAPSPAGLDDHLPGFGAFGTLGGHFFDQGFPVYLRIREMIRVRQAYAPLIYGRQYLRPTRNFGAPFAESPAGELIAWSRILDDEEVLCVVNPHGTQARGADILVDAALNAPAAGLFRVIANTAALRAGSVGSSAVGETLPVQREGDIAYVAVRGIAPSEALVLTNRW